jgi:hypothetical protein
MKFPQFWKKKPEGKKKLVGLSQKPSIAKDLQKIIPDRKPEEPKPEKKVAVKRGFSTPVQPYIAVVTDDIKRLLGIDKKGRKNKEIYRDFLEQHFGRKK